MSGMNDITHLNKGMTSREDRVAWIAARWPVGIEAACGKASGKTKSRTCNQRRVATVDKCGACLRQHYLESTYDELTGRVETKTGRKYAVPVDPPVGIDFSRLAFRY